MSDEQQVQPDEELDQLTRSVVGHNSPLWHARDEVQVLEHRLQQARARLKFEEDRVADVLRRCAPARALAAAQWYDKELVDCVNCPGVFVSPAMRAGATDAQIVAALRSRKWALYQSSSGYELSKERLEFHYPQDRGPRREPILVGPQLVAEIRRVFKIPLPAKALPAKAANAKKPAPAAVQSKAKAKPAPASKPAPRPDKKAAALKPAPKPAPPPAAEPMPEQEYEAPEAVKSLIPDAPNAQRGHLWRAWNIVRLNPGIRDPETVLSMLGRCPFQIFLRVERFIAIRDQLTREAAAAIPPAPDSKPMSRDDAAATVAASDLASTTARRAARERTKPRNGAAPDVLQDGDEAHAQAQPAVAGGVP